MGPKVLKVPPMPADAGQLPRRFPREELRELPLRRETWQVGLMPCHEGSHSEDAPMG